MFPKDIVEYAVIAAAPLDNTPRAGLLNQGIDGTVGVNQQ
jgi:hypothetical protein